MNWTSSRGGCLGPQQRDGGSSVRTMIEPSEAEASEAGPAEAEPAKAEPAEAEPSPLSQLRRSPASADAPGDIRRRSLTDQR